MIIEVLISTLNEGIKNIKLETGDVSYLIVHQVTNGRDEEYKEYFSRVQSLHSVNIRYKQMNVKGLSKSRNFAIKHSIGDILWILDDDVSLLKNSSHYIREEFSKADIDLLIVSHSDVERSSDIEYKKLNLFNSASVSSIDICIKKTALEDKLWFDCSFGLGTKLPSGEEYIFITDCLKNGLKILKTNKICSLHPLEASGIDFYSSFERVNAKYQMMKRIFPNLGWCLFILFCLKKSGYVLRKGHLYNFLRFAVKSLIK